MDFVSPVQQIEALAPDRVRQYEDYFTTLIPTTTEDVFRRWMFAYASVHTTWESNCRLYEMLKPLDWLGNIHVLRDRIRDSRAGLHNNRADQITQFSSFYWRHPTWFNRAPDEPWFKYRDRIMNRAPGIGKAKAAFLLELTCFHASGVACFDTHMVQLYGYTSKVYGQGKVPDKQFEAIKRHWTDACQARGVSPVTARWLYWDAKQQQVNPRYWSRVLEQ